jgi:hypothetical protein
MMEMYKRPGARPMLEGVRESRAEWGSPNEVPRAFDRAAAQAYGLSR